MVNLVAASVQADPVEVAASAAPVSAPVAAVAQVAGLLADASPQSGTTADKLLGQPS